LDGWIDFNSHGGWDYMASLWICNEAGVAVRELEGRDPVVREHAERRTLVVGATPTLVDALFDTRVRHAHV